MDSLKASYCNVNFKKFREKMAQDLFMFYNVSVFDSKVCSVVCDMIQLVITTVLLSSHQTLRSRGMFT